MSFRLPGALFLRNLVERRSLLFQLVRRDFEQRFVGSAVGWIWGVIHPLVLRSEEHTSELQSPCNLVCRLLLVKKKHKAVLYSLFKLHSASTLLNSLTKTKEVEELPSDTLLLPDDHDDTFGASVRNVDSSCLLTAHEWFPEALGAGC